ncbi:MAG: IS1634 family transposase [Bryobacteraceae bacterium]
MYVAEIPNRNSPPAILIRESFRQDGKVKNRTIANISSWPAPRIAALRRLFRGELDLASAPEPTCGPVFGLLHALYQVASDLGISGALGHNRLGKLALFLVLARVAHQGSRLSSVRWARDHAVAEVLGLTDFDEDDLYDALDDLCARQDKIETQLWRNYLARCGTPPALFLYDVTSSYLEGEQNALGQFGYNRDGKRGKLQIVIGLLADSAGEPLAVRVFVGNTADPSTVAAQIEILTQQFSIEDVIFVGDRGMVKKAGKQALDQVGFRYISALTDPQIRLLLSKETIQLELFAEEVCEVEADGVRYVLRNNPEEAKRIRHRLEDKWIKLRDKITQRNKLVDQSARRKPEAGLAALQTWVKRHKMAGLVTLRLDGRHIVETVDPRAELRGLELAGCYVIVTDVAKDKLNTEAVHASYMALQKVERDFRTMKTGLLEIRPIFVRKESRTRGHVFCCLLALKLQRELERRLAAVFGTTAQDPKAVTVTDALAALGRLTFLLFDVDQKTVVARLPKPDEHQRKILDALKVALPAK